MARRRLLLTTDYLLLTTDYLLRTTYYLLLTTCSLDGAAQGVTRARCPAATRAYLLLTTYYLLLTTYYLLGDRLRGLPLLLTTCYLLLTTYAGRHPCTLPGDYEGCRTHVSSFVRAVEEVVSSK
jgi:hypothetical protein